MKNILFLHSSSELYGSDRSLLNIIKYIDKTKFNVYVVLPYMGPLVDELKTIKGIKLKIFEIAVLRRKNFSFKGCIQYFKKFYSSYKYIKQLIKTYKIDILDTNTAVVFPGAIAAKHCHIKSVWHIREIIENSIENKIISRIMNRYADLIIANSISTGKALKVNQKKIRVIYNAVEEKENIIFKENKIFTVGMAGRINRWKGQKLFVDAAEIVHKKLPDIRFEIAGDVYKGEEYIRQELIRYIIEKGLQNTVFLLGQIDNMAEFYNGIDLFVLPSVQPEPFGLVVIEAMEYGIPVIATNHGGPAEIIDNDKNGYLVDYKQANQMAERIIELALNLEKRKSIGMKGKEKKRKEFSLSKMVSNIERVFEEVINMS